MKTSLNVLIAMAAMGLLVQALIYEPGVQEAALKAPAELEYAPVLAIDPLNATYRVLGINVALTDGRFSQISPTGIRTLKSEGDLVLADINDDGQKDTIFILTEEKNGKKFYYVTAALNSNGKYVGLNAAPLGESLTPQYLKFENGLIVSNHEVVRPNTLMSLRPSAGTFRYFVLKNGSIKEISRLETGENIFEGHLIFSEEVPLFKSCGGDILYQISEESPDYSEIMKSFQNTKEKRVFAVLSGSVILNQIPGSYRYGIALKEFIKLYPQGSCPSSDK